MVYNEHKKALNVNDERKSSVVSQYSIRQVTSREPQPFRGWIRVRLVKFEVFTVRGDSEPVLAQRLGGNSREEYGRWKAAAVWRSVEEGAGTVLDEDKDRSGGDFKE